MYKIGNSDDLYHYTKKLNIYQNKTFTEKLPTFF